MQKQSPYKKWVEWTLVLLLIAIVISLVQMYQVIQATDQADYVQQDEENQAETVPEDTGVEMGVIAEQVANRPVDPEDTTLEADVQQATNAAVDARSGSVPVEDSEQSAPASPGTPDVQEQSAVEAAVTSRPPEDESSIE